MLTGFTTRDVCALTGLTYRQIDYWTREGAIAPEHSDGVPGSGHPRHWSVGDARRLAFIAAWRHVAPHDAIHVMAEIWRQLVSHPVLLKADRLFVSEEGGVTLSPCGERGAFLSRAAWVLPEDRRVSSAA